jgi:hypothetical protein
MTPPHCTHWWLDLFQDYRDLIYPMDSMSLLRFI